MLSLTEKRTIQILTFISAILTFIVYLAPEMVNNQNVSLLLVTTSTVAKKDGPTVVLGVFGMKFMLSIIYEDQS